MNDYSTAVHEAGHAVVAHALGMKFAKRAITIRPGRALKSKGAEGQVQVAQIAEAKSPSSCQFPMLLFQQSLRYEQSLLALAQLDDAHHGAEDSADRSGMHVPQLCNFGHREVLVQREWFLWHYRRWFWLIASACRLLEPFKF
jgi:hypothetical protein